MTSRVYATRDEVRAFDRYCIERLGIPGIVLMENAGRQIAEAARGMVRPYGPVLGDAAGPRVLILAGRGNNGGDGYVVARHLAIGGLPAETAVLAARTQIAGDADTNLRILEAMGMPVHVLAGPADETVREVRRLLAQADLVIDGLLGTGARGEIREPYASAIAAVNETGKPVLAIDIPSGLDCDTGRPLGPAIRAAKTVTMAALKIGFRNPEAAAYTGEVIVADIGAPFRRLV
jgi:NAD(P)H-hydrate epimerase